MAKLFLVIALVGFLGLATKTDASCSNGPATCVANTEFDEDCSSCTCDGTGEIKYCCTTYVTPTKVTDGCEFTFNALECKYDIYNPVDSDAVCKILAAVG